MLKNLTKDWNTTGKIKASIVGACAFLCLVSPLQVGGGVETSIAPFFVGILMIPAISKFNQFFLNKEIVKPSWNDNLFNMNRPLIMFHTFSYFFLAVGTCMALSTGIWYQELNVLGLTAFSFGLGSLLGIQLTLKLISTKT
jgi:hypothetical protein